MTGRVRTNNNNALDPRTMPPGGATSGSAGRRSVQHGASVPVLLGQRAVGAARTTALDKKFAAVGYDPVAMQGFVTNFDTNRLTARYEARIDGLLETFDKEFSDICDIRELFYKDHTGKMTYRLKLPGKANIALYNLLCQFMPMGRADYFWTARKLDVTVRLLEGLRDDWRKNRPTEFDLSEVTALETRIAAEGLGDSVVTALKAELTECEFEAAECFAVHGGKDGGLVFIPRRDPEFERAFKAFKKTAIPAYIVLIEKSDPVAARRLFWELLGVHSKDMEIEREDHIFLLEKRDEEIIERSEIYAERGEIELLSLMPIIFDNLPKEEYVGFIVDILYIYSKVNEGHPRHGSGIVEDLHGIVNHVVWKDF